MRRINAMIYINNFNRLLDITHININFERTYIRRGLRNLIFYRIQLYDFQKDQIEFQRFHFFFKDRNYIILKYNGMCDRKISSMD